MVIKSLFIPNAEQINVNLESIQSFLAYIKTKKNIVFNTKIIGWINNSITRNKKKYILECLENIKKVNNNCDYHIWWSNNGKIKLLSNIQRYFGSYLEYDFFVYADHDILIMDDNDILDDISIIGKSIQNCEIVMVSFEQYPDNRHHDFVYFNNFSDYNKIYYYSQDNKHIASGCFVGNVKIIPLFAKLQTKYVYGEEDILIGNMMNQNNFKHVLSKKKIMHDFCNDLVYAKWKKDKIFDIVSKISK